MEITLSFAIRVRYSKFVWWGIKRLILITDTAQQSRLSCRCNLIRRRNGVKGGRRNMWRFRCRCRSILYVSCNKRHRHRHPREEGGGAVLPVGSIEVYSSQCHSPFLFCFLLFLLLADDDEKCIDYWFFVWALCAAAWIFLVLILRWRARLTVVSSS